MTRDPGDATHSALLALVPDAERAVEPHRARLDPAAGWGVPAHVTVLYPFVSPSEIDEALIERVAAAARRLPAVDIALHRVAWFGADTVYLAPEPAEWFRAATDALSCEFPGHPPYGGVFEEVIPHLTIGDHADADDMRCAQREIEQLLPIESRLDHLAPMTGSSRRSSWQVIARFALGPAR